MKIQILGCGAWGTALAEVLLRNGHEVVQTSHRDPSRWTPNSDYIVWAIPSRYLRSYLKQWSPPKVGVISVTKGIEPETCHRVSEVINEAWGDVPYAVLSGPSFAKEVKAQQPTAIVAASRDDALSQAVQQLFHRPEFRVYRSDDVTGVELGGALKNVYAIAAGLCAGLKLGDNSLAALVTRALAEMMRVGVTLGGRFQTFMGLSGVGDLMLTCYGAQSRNRSFGVALAEKKMPYETILPKMSGVVEGVTTVKAVRHLARQHHIVAPIVEEVFQVIYEKKPASQALHDLLARPPETERIVG
ncbi:MAG: NAD(P)-dependent glycerol-3-phosphate dehydrogenase [Verrucomicrobiae bacterium]|nr:NAD(P)-dependent glycerol-3-phosphate dehydrogenase [Verrucomicrobiae bacterium]